MKEIEIKNIDKRYEGLRIKDKSREKEILSSVIEMGVQDPVRAVINKYGEVILLDGFKHRHSRE